MRQQRTPLLRLLAFATVTVLTVVLTVAVLRGPSTPTVGELLRRAAWDGVQSLKVGVSGDVPALSTCVENVCTGFDVEIAWLVADWLGVPRANVSFYYVLPEDRYRMQGRIEGKAAVVPVDLMVAAFSMTRERIDKDKLVFAGPYLSTETTVLTRHDHAPVQALSDLNARRDDGKPQPVCVTGTTTSAGYLQAEAQEARIRTALRNSECVELLLAGEVDAVVTDAAILAGFHAEHPDRLRLHNIASQVDEEWGIGLGKDPTGRDPRIQARRQLVLLALEDLRTTGGQKRWNQAFAELPKPALAPGQTEVQSVAIARQPVPSGLEPVRRWPWERGSSAWSQ